MRAKLFKDVPFARAGIQYYRADEIGGAGGKLVAVERARDTVSRSAATFEGVPITVDHPPDLLTPEQIERRAVGLVSGVIFDVATDQLRGDFLLWDAAAIRNVAEGLRELSAGYLSDYVQNGDGTYRQTGIRGNHVALVPAGRSGMAQRIGG